MATNHLIIGLGGTGGKVIREFRKRYFEDFKDLNPHNDVFVDYLYVDSSDDDLNSKHQWKVLGNDVSLSSAQKVSTQGISLSMLQEINHYPTLNSFISRDDVPMIESSLGKLIDAGIGGQRRRLGRILFANHVNGERGVVQSLENAVRNLTTRSNTADVHFHIVAGLAGGTGSGSIIDMIAQIRKHYPYNISGTKYSVHLYLYVPENTIANASHNSGFYQANGYAALMELNAMSVGQYLPVDVAGEKNIDGSSKRIDSDKPFEVAYLFSNTNENGHILDLGTGVPKMVADFLFHKTVSAGADGSNTKMRRLETNENDGAEPEVDAAGRRNRSRRFMSFGVTRVIYPETEIQEFMTFRNAQQGARQMLFNSWEEGIGFGEITREAIGVGLNDKIRSKEGREANRMTDEYLTLSRPIVETETSKLWKDISKTWNGHKERFIQKILDEKDREEWLGTFVHKMDEYFDSGFRTHGVKRFYEIQDKERFKYAKDLVRGVERQLFDKWANGDMSAMEAEEFVRILDEDCRERIMTDIPKKKSQLTERIKKIKGQLREIRDEWNNIGFFGKLFKSKPENVFNDFASGETQLHIANTMLVAYDYELGMLSAILQELESLKANIKDWERMLNDIYEEFTREAGNRCTERSVLSDINLKEYNRDMVVEMTDSLVRNKDKQLANAAAIRNAILNLLGNEEARYFSNITNRLGVDAVVDEILRICSINVAQEVDELAIANSRYKVLNVNILEKLHEELNTNEKLKAFAEKLVKASKTFLQFNSQEVSKSTGGKVTNTRSMLQLALPEMPEDPNGFRERFITAFAEACPGFNRSEDVSVNPKVNEIVVVAAKSGFPLRHIDNVKTIREAYLKATSDSKEGEMNKYVLHTETFSQELPSLFEMSQQEIGTKFLPSVILGKALGIIKEVEDPETQRKYHALVTTDEWGFDVYTEAGGKDFVSILDHVKGDFDLALKIDHEVKAQLTANYRSNDSKKKLQQEMITMLKEFVLPSYGGNPMARGFKEAQDECRKIFSNELKLL
ncbi:MAG: tubulin-like doman-containing protein [Muribaculaceae bacterium]|nr:tubulin-like doman-containing protein [Muribaculaceae bacterium]